MTKNEIQQRFGKRVRELRKEQNLSQENLAHTSSLDRSYVGQVERGERNITLENIFKLAAGLGVEAHTLLMDT
ncbi:helix-turn-helix domain-containing protein [Moritella viscosa]|uniref:helix-turn-helix domain-containing protein n=1 Tax=Moritella viscosa TaxID=80854 RepID=UPI00094D1254|nr:helix-turn-helix transcriptional regulator [Moritella viscosa]